MLRLNGHLASAKTRPHNACISTSYYNVYRNSHVHVYVYTLSSTCTGHSISTVTRVAGAGEAAGGGIGAGGLRVAGIRYITFIDV